MAQIIIDTNRICYIENEKDIPFLKKLDDELSFRIQGAEHTPQFKYGKWDGIQRILTRNLSFPYGLLDRVKGFYDLNCKNFDLIDKRQEFTDNCSFDISKRLKEINIEPFYYQIDAINAMKNHDCGTIRSCTGSGKTLMMAMLTAHYGKTTTIFVIGKDLLHQFYNFFIKIFDEENVGIIGDGLCKIRDINIVSVWTAAQAINFKGKEIAIEAGDDFEEEQLTQEKYNEILQLLKITKIVALDESHISAAPVLQELSKNINPERIYGFSAAPIRDDGADLLIEAIFGSIIVNITASKLIREGFLVRPLIKFLSIPKQKLERNYQLVYKNYIIENEYRNDLIIENTIKLVEKGYKPLVLFSKLKHGKILGEKFSNKLNIALLSGKDTTEVREQAKKDIETGKIQAIVASTIYDIGLDVPCLSGLVVCGAGKSSVRAIQRIGRVIRAYNKYGIKKANAAVLDFFDQAHFVRDHSKIRHRVYSSEEEYKIIWPG